MKTQTSFRIPLLNWIIGIIRRTVANREGILTDLPREDFPNFTNREVACRHCNRVYVDYNAMVMLQEGRTILNRPVILTSACRCETHNTNIKGSPQSYHIFKIGEAGTRAFDIAFSTGEELMNLIFVYYVVGFRRFGINFDQNFLHIDTGERGHTGSGLIFSYKKKAPVLPEAPGDPYETRPVYLTGG